MDAAISALTSEYPDAAARQAVMIPMPNAPGAVDKAMKGLVQRGFCIESILVLATHAPGDRVRVSFGLARCREDGWEHTSEGLSEEIVAEIGA
jgi:hypothetical protein